MLNKILQVFIFGAKKYSKDGWKHIEKEKYLKSLNNHVAKYKTCVEKDDESGLIHAAHIAANAIILLWHEDNGNEEGGV